MSNDDIATLMNNAAGQDWGTEMHFRRFAYMLLAAEREACAQVAESTVCDTHLPTGVQIYGSRAAKVIRARSKT